MRGINRVFGNTLKNLKNQQGAAKRLGKELESLKITMAEKGKTAVLVEQQKKLEAQFKKTTQSVEIQRDKLDKLSKTQERIREGRSQMWWGSKKLATAGALGYAGMRFMQPGFEFSRTMSRVQALTRLDKDSEDFKALRDQANELGRLTWATASEVAEGQAFYAMAGFKPEEIQNSMRATLALARAGSMEIGRAADIGSNILSSFGLEASEMERVANTLAATFTRTNTDLEMLGQSMKYAAKVSKDVGLTLEETSAFVGLLGNVGIQADQSGTAIRKIMSRLADPPKKAQDALEALNIEVKDLEGNLKSPIKIFEELFNAVQEMGSADRMAALSAISGLEASSAMLTFVEGEFFGQYHELLKEVNDAHAKGEVFKMESIMDDNLPGDLNRLKSAFASIQIAFAQNEEGGLRSLVQRLTELTSNISHFLQQNPKVISAISKIGAGLVAVTAIIGGMAVVVGAAKITAAFLSLGAIITKIGSLLAPLSAVFTVLKGVMTIAFALSKGLAVFLVTNPIGLAITAVVTLTGAVYLLYKNWDKVKRAVSSAGRVISNLFKGGPLSALNRITSGLGKIPYIGKAIEGVFKFITIPLRGGLTLIEALPMAFTAVKSAALSAWGLITRALEEGPLKTLGRIAEWLGEIPLVGGLVKRAFESITMPLRVIFTIVEALPMAFTAVKSAVMSVWGAITRGFEEGPTQTLNRISNWLGEIPLVGKAISAAFEIAMIPIRTMLGTLDLIKQSFNWIIGRADSIKMPKAFTAIGDFAGKLLPGRKEEGGEAPAPTNAPDSVPLLPPASPVSNNVQNNNEIKVEVHAKTNASPQAIGGGVVQALTGSGLLGDTY